MSWLDDIHKDLQDARQHSSREKKDWEIERDIRLKYQSSEAGKSNVKKHSSYEKTIHREMVCEYCGETNIPTNISQTHKDGACIEYKIRNENMKKDYDSGMTGVQVSRKYSISNSRFREIFEERGWELRKRTKVTKEMRQHMLDLLADGVAKTKVAEIYNISFRKLQKILSEE